MGKSARQTALSVLVACRQNGAWSDGTLKAALRRDALEPRDAALATRICYGVLQNRALLDFYIGAHCSQRTDRLEPIILEILRIGAYQIVFMDKIPPSAAVNEAVEMTKRHKRSKASGLVNAVLRSLARNKDALPQPDRTDMAAYLSLLYSHPRWLVDRLLPILGAQETEAFLRANNDAVPTTVQINTLKTTPDALTAELSAEGVGACVHPLVEGCFTLTGAGNIESLAAFSDGRIMVQDAAAKLAVLAAAPRVGSRVLDVCAAPGGKSFAAAIAMENSGEIISCDIHAHKLRLIESGAARLGISCIKTELADGRTPRTEWIGAFDTVICDVPCSGLGIIRKKPDIRYKDEAELSKLPAVQRAILENACTYVREGGVLLYATCTILPEENECITDDFLRAHPEFSAETYDLPSLGTVTGGITLWPQRHGTDGFYICKLRKKAKEEV
ncbi:MAG: 16S rRNA (cytosine(967)-C(5))-methyltransferase RsmB [Oscillospiraceae bacterium]|nr:16S rRNA (cytosine(967)-C(5))-methyltransferase RsmB [Oscillospiraceae bacterium]